MHADLESIVCKSGGDPAMGHLPARSDWSARIIYIVTCYIVASQTYRQTDYNTSLPLAGEVIKKRNSSKSPGLC